MKCLDGFIFISKIFVCLGFNLYLCSVISIIKFMTMMKLPSFLLFAAVSLAASAQVKVDSQNRLVLGNDGYAKAGGKLQVEAHDIQFGLGFVVEPGGTIDIQIKK